MEKTIHITIAKTEFNLTEAAYAKLREYLESLKNYFSAEIEKAEIVSDIESRIAEKLLEKKSGVIYETEIEAVIKEIGTASEFEPREEKSGVRKLYRDPNDAIIAGVASGIAHYFNIDPLIVRCLFAISIFAGGTGVVVYIIMALLIPEAKTASQKLEMHGDKINLESIKQTVKERVAEVKERGTFQKIIRFPFEVVGKIFRFVFQKIFPIFGKVFGFFLSLGSFIAILALTVGMAVVIANLDKSYVDLPLLIMTSHGLLWLGIIASYVSVLIPLIFLTSFGLRLVNRKQFIGNALGFGLLGVWCIGVITLGVVGTRVTGDYYAYTSTHPDYQESSTIIDVGAFEKIEADESEITFEVGTSTSVSIEGRAIDLGNVKVEVVDGTLMISKIKHAERCIFCSYRSPSVVITEPNVSEIKINNSTMRGEITQGNLNLDVKNGNVNTKLDVGTLTLSSLNSYIELRGKASSSKLNLENTLLRTHNFLSDNLETIKDDSSWIEGLENKL